MLLLVLTSGIAKARDGADLPLYTPVVGRWADPGMVFRTWALGPDIPGFES